MEQCVKMLIVQRDLSARVFLIMTFVILHDELAEKNEHRKRCHGSRGLLVVRRFGWLPKKLI